jgi:hypothetical protein
MEYLDSIVRAFSGCTGMLEVLAIVFDVSAGYLGVKTLQKHRHVSQKLAQVHGRASLKKPNWWPVVILGIFGLVFTGLTAWKYLHGVN